MLGDCVDKNVLRKKQQLYKAKKKKKTLQKKHFNTCYGEHFSWKFHNGE